METVPSTSFAKPAPGFYGNLSEDQNAKLQELKSVVIGIVPDPASAPKNARVYDEPMLTRFLRARSWDVNAALNMIKADVAWRKANKVDTILDEYYALFPRAKEITTYWPSVLHGSDKRGMVMYCERIAQVDPKSVFANVNRENLVSFHIWIMENGEKAIREGARKVGMGCDYGIVMIEDLTGLGWRHMHTGALNALKECLGIDTQYYPESLAGLYVINAPPIFSLFWKILKPFMDPNTVKKMGIFGCNDWRDGLKDVIDINSLPEGMGGKCVCKQDEASGKCLPVGGVFGAGVIDENAPVKVSVSARSHLEIEVVVNSSGSAIVWEFATDGYDIGFAVLHKREDKKSEVHSYSRVNAHPEPAQGRLLVETEGTYLLHFDNSFSTFRKKTVTYRVFVEEPGEIGAKAEELGLEKIVKEESPGKESEEERANKRNSGSVNQIEESSGAERKEEAEKEEGKKKKKKKRSSKRISSAADESV